MQRAKNVACRKKSEKLDMKNASEKNMTSSKVCSESSKEIDNKEKEMRDEVMREDKTAAEENKSKVADETKEKAAKVQYINKKIQVEKETAVHEIVEALCKESGRLALHLFEATYQRNMYLRAKEDLPEYVLLSVQDFAENYRTMYQDEISSAHFTYEQVTLFTQVSNYHCPTCPDALVEESVVFISSDTSHSPGFINTCMKMYHDDLKGNNVDIKHEIIFSDGCASQFKSKTPFSYVAESKCGHSIQREYFGSGHGKSSCDSLGGLVKRTAIKYVAAGTFVIREAVDLFTFANKVLVEQCNCKAGIHKTRKFFYVEYTDEPSTQKLKHILYTRSLHSIRSGGEPGLVKYRGCSCFCEACLEGRYDECQNVHAGMFASLNFSAINNSYNEGISTT